MNWLSRRFATLRWRLTLSYVVTAFVALVTLEGAFFLVSSLIATQASLRPITLLQGMQRLAPQVAPHLWPSATGQIDRAGLDAWLHASKDPIAFSDTVLVANNASNFSIFPGQNTLLSVLGADGKTIDSLGPTNSGFGQLGNIAHQPEAQAAITAALQRQSDAADLLRTTQTGQTIVAVPVTATDGQLLGVLTLSMDLHTLKSHIIQNYVVSLFYSFIPFSFIAILLGTAIGLLIARGLRRRLSHLTVAANAWGRGDFDTVAHDPTPDELGYLARDLTRMAARLQTLLQSRQQLVVVEERQRLARDLHDSVKQQIFAASMQIAAARAIVRRDPDKAEARLDEVERQIGESLRELTVLIRELRPAALANQGLGPAISGLAEEWSRRNAIPLDVHLQGERPVELEVEEALFRVTQEALANVAKHSHAQHVHVQVIWDAQRVTLLVADDGVGLDIAAATGKGFGLQSMQERVEGLGGTLAIHHAAKGSGTLIEATIPLREPAASSAIPFSPQLSADRIEGES